MIIVVGNLVVDPADVDAFLRDLSEIDPSRRAGSGCISYVTAPKDMRSGRLVVAERWRDEPSLAEHLAHERTSAFIRKWAGKMQGEVLKYDAFNERPLMAKP